MWDNIEVDNVVVYKQYYPPTVKQVTASGSSAFIGEVDESTIMKYPLAPGRDMSWLEIKRKLLEIIGPYKHVIRLKSFLDYRLYLERAGILYYNIQPTNILLDEELYIKLLDFQGKQLSRDGIVLLDGRSGEPSRFYCPQANPFNADIKTDLFALGCTIYLIIIGHPVFPEIIDREDRWFEKVQEKFT
ncbi:uncharacterized protein BJX67DRAFT_371017 [Aspergillus lucknowensis]|uniref:Protein kinase domain-containing protein n=1 Tax=Aspergillus lucknowensis TaxID=176173 RepID=A0ABR4LXV5_9EURO